MTLAAPSPGRSVLCVRPERLISAAGGLDALVAEFGTGELEPVASSIDAGEPELSGAISEFVEAWNTGLYVLLHDQQTTARGLRRAASEVLGVDVDAAYAFRSALGEGPR